ncbi:ATP-binding protein [Thalassotalea psychrophila]|uniref:histidine kinase n=1 Tax=Thalassotalea psychrophila TaxID=3065647 RepID=A0ABY9TUI8_9GAMM|nr:ATP-binding protein [Colwelliaceae bacterium SQ149]
MSQDSNGFLWYAGFNGLLRFDGYEIKEFIHDPDNANSIAENAIRTITADKQGGLWISLYNLGLAHYDAKTGNFSHFPHDKNNVNTPSSNTIRDIIVLDNGDLWIGGRAGLSYYSLKDKTFTHYNSGSDVKNDSYTIDMTIDNSGKLWLATARGLKFFDENKKQLVVPKLLTPTKQPISEQQQLTLFRKIITAKDGRLWLAGYQANIHLLDPNANALSQVKGDSKSGKYNHMAIEQVNEKEIWVSNLTNGIEIFDARTTRKINHIDPTTNSTLTLKSKKVDAIFTDAAGTVWLSFNGSKLQYYNQSLSAFQYIHLDEELTSEEMVYLLPLSTDNSLLSVNKKLILFNKKNGEQKLLDFPGDSEQGKQTWEVSALARGVNNSIWLTTTNSTLIKFDLISQQKTYYSYASMGFKGNNPYDINYISEQEIMLSTSGGPIVFNPQIEEFETLQTTNKEDITERTWHTYKSEQGDYYIATNIGLYYQLSNQQDFSFLPLNKNNLRGSSVERILQGKKGEIFLFTNQTVYYLEVKGDKLILNELPAPPDSLSLNFMSLNIDNKGNLWFGPYAYYDPYQQQYHSLGHYDVLNNKTPNSLEVLGDTIYAVSDSSIILINTEQLTPLSYQAPIKLIEFKSGRSINAANGSKVNVAADRQELSAKFSALDLVNADNTQYEYRLKGYDDYWRTTPTNERRATYTSLPPGDFTLEIKAQHQSANLSHKTLSIPVTVLPKFYQTWWFITCILTLTAWLLWFIHKLFLQKAMLRETELNTHKLALERAKMMEELIEKKNQLLADVSHELGTPLTVLKLQVESLKDELEDDVQVTYDALDNKLDDIQHLINDIHQLAQSDIGALQLNKETFEFNETLDLWQRELTQFVNNNKLSFDINRQLPPHLMVEFDRDRIKQIFTNLLTNSIKYTDKPGQVILSASTKKNTLLLSIEDSGPGVSTIDLTNIFERLYRVETSRSRDTGGSGLGLAICKSLIEEHNGKIYANHSALGGLKINMELPIL